MPYFDHDAIRFHFQETGAGLPFVFQHGLGADVTQPIGLVRPPDGCRILAFDCRAHGLTEPVGPETKIAIASFADDLAALLDELRIERAVVGGISMGAAVSLNFALRFPDRALGIIQSRPAWLAGPNHENSRKFDYVAELLREHGPLRGKQFFVNSEMFHELQVESPDVANSLAGQFDSPRAAERAVRLARIPRDAPFDNLTQLAAIRVPVLVLANRHDPVHPFEYGETLAGAIEGAEFHEITAKSLSIDRHAADVRSHVTTFLQRHYL